MIESIIYEFFSFVVILVSYTVIYTWTSKVIYPHLPSFFVLEAAEKPIRLTSDSDQRFSDRNLPYEDARNNNTLNEKSYYGVQVDENNFTATSLSDTIDDGFSDQRNKYNSNSKLINIIFNATITCSLALIELYLLQLINFLSSSVNRFFFQLNLKVLAVMILVVIPALLLYFLTNHFYRMFGLDTRLQFVFDRMGVFNSHSASSYNGMQQQQQVSLITFAVFLVWIIGITNVHKFFPSTKNGHCKNGNGGAEESSKLINVSDESDFSISARCMTNLALVGITIMGSITGFNSVLTIKRNVLQKKSISGSTKEEKLGLLRRNLKLLMRNHQEIYDSLETKKKNYAMLKRSTGANTYSQQDLNELATQIKSFESYLQMVKSSIQKAKHKINAFETSTSLFMDIMNLNFTKFENFFNKLMVVYCIYRYFSIILVKIPILVYNYFFITQAANTSSFGSRDKRSTASNSQVDDHSKSSLSINLRNYLHKTYYQRPDSATNTGMDELLLLNKIELIISLFFFVSCFTGVLSTFNNLILIFSKLSSKVSRDKEKSAIQQAPIPSVNVNDNPYSASLSSSPLPINITEISNVGSSAITMTPGQYSRNPNGRDFDITPTYQGEQNHSQQQQQHYQCSLSMSTGSNRIKNAPSGLLTPTRTSLLTGLSNSRIENTNTKMSPVNIHNKLLGSPLKTAKSLKGKKSVEFNNKSKHLDAPFNFISSENSNSYQYADIDFGVHDHSKEPHNKLLSSFVPLAFLSRSSNTMDFKLTLSEQLRFLSNQSQAVLISNCEKLLISQLTGIYIIATSLMLRSAFSSNSIQIINGLYNLYEFNTHYLDYLFEFWFIIASVVTVLVLVFDTKRHLIDSSEDGVDSYDSAVEEGRVYYGSGGIVS